MTADKSKKRLALVATASAVHVDRWEWRQLIASQYGPASATTRHVLHVLALYMSDAGGNCWPTQSAVAKRAALTTRAVKMHIAIAKRSFWIRVTEHQATGQSWRRNSYTATVPAKLHPLVVSLKKGAPPDLGVSAGRGEPGSPSWGTIFPSMGNDVPTNLIRESDQESVRRVAAVDKSSKRARSGAADRSTKDDLKNRSERSGALRAQIAAAARALPTRSSSPSSLTDAELAAKVRKLRGVGQGDGDIRRALASQASPAQLTRVLRSK